MSQLTAPVIVLGMHRSGTSCLAGSLQQAGLTLGEVFTQNPYNKKGNREHPDLMALHEAVLEANGGSWYQPPERVVWTPEQVARRETFIDQFVGTAPWGFKDPRTLILLEGWLERFPDARLVGTIRHPLAVAASLKHRNPDLCSTDEYIALWETYNERLLQVYQERRIPVIDFDVPDDRYGDSLARAFDALGLRRKGTQATPFFDPALRTHRQEGTEGLPEQTARVYRELKQVAL